MKALFSKRHERAIAEKRLKLSFTVASRTSILRLLSQYSEYGGYNGMENRTFAHVEEDLKTFYGVSDLIAFGNNNQRVPAALPEFILGCYPSEVLDVIECWFNQAVSAASACETELNDALTIHRTPWRVIRGQVILIDSDYLHAELQAKTITLLRENEVGGALEEYQEALNHLAAGEAKDAIAEAHKSVESVMKAVLRTDQPLRFGQLLSRLIASGIVPEYYEDFYKNFEQLALGIGKERNLPGRAHGQGRVPAPVPTALAEFAVNLAGAMNVFMLKRWVEIGQPVDSHETPRANRLL